MKITKRELKRIIAEEHALVYGKKLIGRRKTSKKQHMHEAKRQLVVEIQSRAISNEILEEGFFDALKAGVKALGSLGGKAASAAAQKASDAGANIAKKAEEMKSAAGEQIQALKDKGNEALATVQEEYLKKLQAELKAKIAAATQELAKAMKQEDDSLDDAAIKGAVSPIIMTAVTAALSESVIGSKRAKLVESKNRRNKRRR
jgi:hypothetical protein